MSDEKEGPPSDASAGPDEDPAESEPPARLPRELRSVPALELLETLEAARQYALALTKSRDRADRLVARMYPKLATTRPWDARQGPLLRHVLGIIKRDACLGSTSGELPSSPDQALADQLMEESLAMSPEAPRVALLAAGYTPKELDAKADALLGPLGLSIVPPPSEGGDRQRAAPLARPARPPWVPYAAVAGLVVVLGYAYVRSLLQADDRVTHPSDPDKEDKHLEAEALRSEAASALENGQWARAIALLDEAKKKDPRGDEAPGVEYARGIARGKLGLNDGGDPSSE